MTFLVDIGDRGLANTAYWSRHMPDRVDELGDWIELFAARASHRFKVNFGSVILFDVERAEEFESNDRDLSTALASITARCTEGMA